ncbi:outer membrane protein [Desulforhopalus sp. 52FAK]
MIMKKALLTTALIFTASSAMAANNWYMSADLGVQIPGGEASHAGTNEHDTPSYDFDESVVAGLAVGYFFNDAFRVEAEARFRNQETEDGTLAGLNSRSNETFNLGGEVDTTTLMANAIYEFDNTSKFIPYVKGGLGVAYSDASADFDLQPTFSMYGITDRWDFPDNDETNFAWSIGAGVDYQITDNILVGLEYQYIDMGDISTGVDINGDMVDFDLSAHEITVGITYLF